MKLVETCPCGASMTVEHDDADRAEATLGAWHNRHRCAQPTAGNSGGQIGFGNPPANTHGRVDVQ